MKNLKKQSSKHDRKLPSPELIKIYDSIDFDKKQDLLNRIIEESLNEYIILNFGFIEDNFITEEQEKEMISGVFKRVYNRLSPAIMENLYFIFNAKNDDELLTFISTQVALKVVDYKVTNNQPTEG